MAVSFAAVQIKPPGKKNGNHGNTPLKVWVVRVWEVNPPKGKNASSGFWLPISLCLALRMLIALLAGTSVDGLLRNITRA